MKKSLAFVIAILFSSLSASGQTPSPTPAPAPSPTPSPPPEEKKKEADFNSMVQGTLPQDIDTASYYELVSWCRLLGLDEAGDKTVLAQRLKDHFKLQGPAEKREVLKRIEIKSARSSEYFTLDSVKEDYVLIQGNVVIVLSDKKDNSTHTIHAERVLYNQSKNTISASGNVLYKRKIGDKEEAFTGETFIFDVENWEGVLYYAQGERAKKMEDKTVLFRYSGETVTRLKDNSILLEKGVITSSANLDNPHYKITANRIWVYAPGEWSIENAVLYLGNIPVLYIPFYFYTSDELFFNPVIGYKLREGAFYENTVYLYGKKQREDSPLSFLQLEESSGQDYEMKLQGLYLRPVKKEGGAAAAAPQDQAAQAAAVKHLKLFLDFYTRLGGFAGVSLDASPAFKLSGGVGLSRSIFFVNNAYTPYYLGSDSWNSGYFFNLKLPIRFGLQTNFTLSAGLLQRLQGDLYLFSDPFFEQDFYSRTESQDWGKLLGFELLTPSATTSTLSTAQRPNLAWTLNAGLSFAQIFGSPAILNNLRLDPFKFTLEWGSKTNQSITTWPYTEVDPARLFYYPTRLIFPDFTVSLGGTALQHTSTNAVAAAPAGTAQSGSLLGDLRLSGSDSGGPPADTVPLPGPFDLRRPDIKPDAPVTRTITFFNTNLSYSLNHQFKMEHLFAHDGWTTVEGITYFTKNSVFDHTGTSSLKYKFTFWNAVFDIDGTFTVLDKFKTTYTPSLGFDQTAADRLFTRLDLVNNVTASYAPFIASPDFKDTKLSYNLVWDFYNIYYNTGVSLFRERFFEFNRDTVTAQQVTATFAFQPEDKLHYLRLTARIPPVLGSFSAELNFFLWMFQTTIYGEYKEETSGAWNFEPLQVTEIVTLDTILLLSSKYRHDMRINSPLDWDTRASLFKYRYLERDRYLIDQQLNYNFTVSSFTKSLTTIDLWNIQTVLLMQRMYPLSALGNVTGSAQEFRFYTASLSYDWNLTEIYLWRNRIEFRAKVKPMLELNFQKYVDSKFTLSLELGLKVYKFMDFVFTVQVANRNVYRYIPPFVDAVNAELFSTYGITANLTPINPLEDLLRSFNFFNIEDRYNSFFKLQSLSLGLVHYLDDWIFTLTFSGEFKFQTQSNGTQLYEWQPKVSFSLQWLGIPQIKKEVTGDNTGLKL